jgi:division protein CdvB (Snf7/Vps24/ESCRT-III family)
MRFNLGSFGFGLKKSPPLKERIAAAIYRIDTQRNKLEQTSAKLHERDRDMFQRCIGAKASSDLSRAAMYANECVEIRKMARIVLSSELALERVSLRLQTIEDFGDVAIHMGPVVNIVREMKGKLVGVIPEVAYELEEINTLLNGTITEAGDAFNTELSVATATDEAKKVLEEATVIAEHKMSEIYPELPFPELREKERATGERPILATPQEELEEEIKSIPLEELERQVFDYIRNAHGELNLKACANTFKVPRNDVKKAIDNLANSGKIVLK